METTLSFLESETPLIVFFLILLVLLLFFVFRSFYLKTKIEILQILMEDKLSSDLFEHIKILPKRYFDHFLLAQITKYYDRCITSPESLRECRKYLTESQINNKYRDYFERALRQAMLSKSLHDFTKIYADCFIMEACYKRDFSEEKEFLHRIMWEDIFPVHTKEEVYLIIKNHIISFMAAPINLEFRDSIISMAGGLSEQVYQLPKISMVRLIAEYYDG